MNEDNVITIYTNKDAAWKGLRRSHKNFFHISDDHIDLDMCSYAIEQWISLRYIDPRFRSVEFDRKAVEINPYNLEYVPDEDKTVEMCKMALQHDLSIMNYIPSWLMDPKMCADAFDRDYDELHKSLTSWEHIVTDCPFEEETIDLMITVMRYGKNNELITKPIESHEKEEICSICLLSSEESDECIKTNCNHIFHMNCLEGWLKTHSTCPMCVRNLYEIPDIEKPYFLYTDADRHGLLEFIYRRR
jgi:hypothetical protein